MINFLFRPDGKLPFRDSFAYGKSHRLGIEKKNFELLFFFNFLACPKFISPAPTIFEQRTDAQWAVSLTKI